MAVRKAGQLFTGFKAVGTRPSPRGAKPVIAQLVQSSPVRPVVKQ